MLRRNSAGISRTIFRMSAKTNNLCLFKYDPSTDGAQTFNIKQALNDNWDKIDAAVLLALAAAAPYSETQTYALGTYCTKDAKLYRCTTAITTTEAWTAAHWTETSMGAELVAIYAALAAKAPSTHASQHGASGSDPITPASIGAAVSSHNHSAAEITSGTLPVARGGTGQTTVTPAVGTAGVRQIYAGTSDMTAGSTSLTTGVVYFVYE